MDISIRKDQIVATMNTEGGLASPEDLARFLGVPLRTLGQWRYLGKGPKSIKVGRYVRYRMADVERWLDSNERPAA